MAMVPSSKDHPASTSATLLQRRGEEERAGSEKLSGAEDDDLKKVSGTIGRLTKLRRATSIVNAIWRTPSFLQLHGLHRIGADQLTTMTGDHDFSALQRYGRVDEDNLNARQPLEQLQRSHNIPQDSYLTNECTSDAPEDMPPPDPVVNIPEENGVGAIQPIRRQQTWRDAHRSSQVTNERTSDSGTDHMPPSSSSFSPLQIDINDGQTLMHNAFLGSSSSDASSAVEGISDNDRNHITILLLFAPVALLAIFVLLGLLYLFHVMR